MPDRPRIAVDPDRRERTVDTAGTLRCLKGITGNVGSTFSVLAALPQTRSPLGLR